VKQSLNGGRAVHGGIEPTIEECGPGDARGVYGKEFLCDADAHVVGDECCRLDAEVCPDCLDQRGLFDEVVVVVARLVTGSESEQIEARELAAGAHQSWDDVVPVV
jgi:hypothetical protein